MKHKNSKGVDVVKKCIKLSFISNEERQSKWENKTWNDKLWVALY